MAFTPGRDQPILNQPGNPFAPNGQPSLRHPASNPSGLLPGTPVVPRGPECFTDVRFQNFVSNGIDQVWLWESPVFDLRPGVSVGYGNMTPSVPINHEAALGQSIYLTLILGEASGTAPPASMNGVTAVYWEDGNAITGDNTQLMRLTQNQDVTELLLAGGTSLAAPFGASPFSITPCAISLHFWKVSFQVTIAGIAPITLPYFIQAALH